MSACLLPEAQAVVPPPDGDYPGGNTAEGQNRVPSASPFTVGATTHETWANSQAALQFPNAREITAEIETLSSVRPTRSSFIASWDNVAGATGYLLDVATSGRLAMDYRSVRPHAVRWIGFSEDDDRINR